MTAAEIKTFLATPKGRLVAACSALVLCWIILLPILFGDFFASGGASGVRGELELKKARNAFAAAQVQKSEADALRDRYRRLIDGAWREERDGMIEVGMRRLVAEAADSVENFKLQNITFDLHNSGMENNVMTEYEMKFSQEGMPIYRLEARYLGWKE